MTTARKLSVRRIGAVPAALIAIAALVVGLAAPAAAREAKHLISGSSIKKHSIAGNRLKNGTLTGKQIKPNSITGAQVNESTLGTVPNASKLDGLSASAFRGKPMWAYVEADGTIGAQSGGITDEAISGYSFYYLTFPSSAANQPISVTPHYDQSGGSHIGSASAAVCGDPSDSDSPASGEMACGLGANNSSEVFVEMNGNDSEANEGFYIIVG